MHQQSQDSKSIACRSECLSEHYIRAKKFAALRTNRKNKKEGKQISVAAETSESDIYTNG